MAIGDRNEPVGAPSLSEEEIIFLYQKYLGRSPDGVELQSEKGNALKYSAAGIEQQIANRAGNTAGSGVRGDEGTAPLTIPYVPPPPSYAGIPSEVLGHVMTMGPSAFAGGPVPSGPTGTIFPGYSGPYPVATGASAGVLGGLSMTTLLILGAVALAAYYLLVKR